MHVPPVTDVFGAAAARGAGLKGRNGSAVPASAPVGGAFVREGERERERDAWRWAHRTREAETWVDTDTDADAEGSEGGLWEIEVEGEAE